MSGHEARLEHDLTAEQGERFREYIHEHSGIHLDDGRTDALRISLMTRATRFCHESLDHYYELLVADEAEFRELMNLITINETSFFRFPAQFDALRTFVVPEILDTRSPALGSFRTWSAGCSTGEEPYSIAMTLLDAGIDSLGHHAEVLGTDVSTHALERAKAGIYTPRSLLNVPHEIVTRYFEPTATGHRVTDPVRDVVDFRYQNLIKEPYPSALMGNWDVIFCRNVTIYFRIESTRRVVESLFERLNPGGYLFIGHSETLTGISDRFETVEVGGVFLHRKPTAAVRVSVPERPQSARAVAAAGAPQFPARAVEPGAPASEPSGAAAHLRAAQALADNGDFDAALERVTEAVRIDPALAAARYVLGLIHLRAGRTDDAVAEFGRTVGIDDDFVLAHLNLGNIHRARGEHAHACREYEAALRALERSPDGAWSEFLGGFDPEVLVMTCRRSLDHCSSMRERG
ncbi:MAG: tetratricopeptide repeat protein [Coriobacteriia bacterium]|nr:tetratricopeptide repeat protein [Coriobacteriia bacterium]